MKPSEAVSEFSKRVDAKIQTGMSRAAAVAAVAKSDKELHCLYLCATNPKQSDEIMRNYPL